jgi:hypothetical protein
MLPVSIDCRVAGGPRLDPTFAVKVNYRKTNRAVQWSWTVGNEAHVSRENVKHQRDGLHQVSSNRLYDKRVGATAACALWHS